MVISKHFFAPLEGKICILIYLESKVVSHDGERIKNKTHIGFCLKMKKNRNAYTF